MTPTCSNDPVAQKIHIEAHKAAERNVYTLTNPYTTREEKVAIESWYQLPINISGIAYILTCLFWSWGSISFWEAYFIAVAVGVLTAVILWFMYIRKLVFGLSMLLDFPLVGWIIHLGFAAWLGFSGSWTQAIFIAGNRLLFLLPVGFGAIIANQKLASKYPMHPKYAFLKRFYGKTYPFE